MPIKIQSELPAYEELISENIFVMTMDRASTQNIRPIRIAILNLMPTKIETETQLLRLLGNSPLQVDIELMQVASHVHKSTPQEHLTNFYKTFSELKDEYFDGMIITGAPVEKLPFEEVDYWEELCDIMKWSQTHVFSTLHICWGAQAGLYYHYGIPKYEFDEKLSGVYKHKVTEVFHPLMRGFDDRFLIPHSRYTGVHRSDIRKHKELIILASSTLAGAAIIASRDFRRVFILGHAEYDRNTLANEYFRDLKRGLRPEIPYNYFPADDTSALPPITWRSNATLFYTNWLNNVYQETPYKLEDIKNIPVGIYE